MKLVEGMGEFWFRRPAPGPTAASALEVLHSMGFTKAKSIQSLPFHYERYENAIPFLLQVMRTTREPVTFAMCLDAIEVKWAGPEVAEALLGLFRECDSVHHRSSIAETIWHVPYKHLLEELYVEATNRENSWARLDLLLALAKARDPRAFGLGMQLLEESTNGGWSAQVLEGLNATRDPRAKEVAGRFVDDPDVRLRDEARRILKLPRKRK